MLRTAGHPFLPTALSVFYVRKFVKEPEVWVENRRLQRTQQREVKAPLLAIFKPIVLGNTLTACWWMAGGFICYYSINLAVRDASAKGFGP